MFTWGGEWALPLAATIKRNLTWFFFDGLFASASDNIIITYVTLYILALGATNAQIGLMSSFSSLASAVLLLPGAFLVERYGHRKEFTIAFGGGIARLAILILALLPFFVGGTGIVWLAIGLSVTRDSFGNLSFPAWMSITADIVPMEGRGRFFASRNFIMGITGMLAILLVGELITRTSIPRGYQIGMGLAFVLGMASTFSFSHLSDPKGTVPPVQLAGSLSPRTILHELVTHPEFLALSLVMAFWNFTLNIASPFFNVYMVENLKFTASMVGIVSIVSSITGLLIQRRIGRLSDRWGPRKLQMIFMFLIPILPFAWLFVTKYWHVILLNSISGVLWAAFNLVSFNFLLSLTPDAQRARFSAFYQILVMLALAGGAAVGAWVVTAWGYQAIFLCSAIGRVAAAFLFIRFVPPVTKRAKLLLNG
ncbi:MAG: MFS transporter [Anaerolineales bacterium]|jgi:MFS family permease